MKWPTRWKYGRSRGSFWGHLALLSKWDPVENNSICIWKDMEYGIGLPGWLYSRKWGVEGVHVRLTCRQSAGNGGARTGEANACHHGSELHPEMMAAAMFLAVAKCGWRWLRAPSRPLGPRRPRIPSQRGRQAQSQEPPCVASAEENNQWFRDNT